MYTKLIEPSELAALLQRAVQPSPLAVVDCRFELARPDWGAGAYAAGHIPNAVYAHLDRDLSGPVSPQSGRHPLPSPEAFSATMSRLGVDAGTQVVAYDQGNGAHAARLWWLLRWAGHTQVAVLDGGYAAWQQAGLPVSTESTVRAARFFEAHPNRASVVTTADLEKLVSGADLASGRVALVDARGPDRFAGQNETLDPVAGHVPGARNHPFVRNVDAQGRFLAAEELHRQWLATLAGTAPSNAVAMCGSGVTACHNLLALEIAGLPGARLYCGSWSEWIRDPARPVATGVTAANDPNF